MTERTSGLDDEERPMNEAGLEDWEEVVPEPSTRSAVLTVRLSPHELRQIRDVANATGQTMAEVMRSAMTAYLSRQGSLVSMGWSWSTGVGAANVLARSGLVTLGQGFLVPQEETQAAEGGAAS